MQATSGTLFGTPAYPIIIRAMMRLACVHAEFSVEKRDAIFATGLMEEAASCGVADTIEAAMLATSLRSGSGVFTPSDSEEDDTPSTNTWHTVIATAEPNYFLPWAARLTSPLPLRDKVRWVSCAICMVRFFAYETLEPLFSALPGLLHDVVDSSLGEVDVTISGGEKESQERLIHIPAQGVGQARAPPQTMTVLLLSILECTQTFCSRFREEYLASPLHEEVLRMYRLDGGVAAEGSVFPGAVCNAVVQVLSTAGVDFNVIKPDAPEKTTIEEANTTPLPSPRTPRSPRSPKKSVEEEKRESELPFSPQPERRLSIESEPAVVSLPPSPVEKMNMAKLSQPRLSADSALLEAIARRVEDNANDAEPPQHLDTTEPPLHVEATETTVPTPNVASGGVVESRPEQGGGASGGGGGPSGTNWTTMTELDYLGKVKVFQYFDVMTQRLLERRPSGAPLQIIKELKGVLAELEDECV